MYDAGARRRHAWWKLARAGGSSPVGESVRELGVAAFLFVVGLKLDLKLIRTLGFVAVDFSILFEA